MGSNRGAYVKLGPDLVPYVIQYQASSMTRELTVRQRYKNYQKIAIMCIVLRGLQLVHLFIISVIYQFIVLLFRELKVTNCLFCPTET